MADVDENDDQWLYGSNSAPEGFQNPENPEENEAQDFQKHAPVPFQDDGPPGVDNDYEQEMPDPEPALVPEEIPQEPVNDQPPVLENETEDGELQQNGDDSDKEGLDDDSDDDDINVVIGDIKAPTAYSQPNIKRGGLTTTIGDKSKQVQQSGKFAVEEFDQVGTINGVPSVEYNLDSLEDKPWRKPGADISDYFNYGFNEDTWKAYCERQRRIRMNESGVGVMQITTLGMPRPMVQNFQMPRPMNVPQPEVPKMNTIQVMTADRREYSRKPVGFPDLSVPPPFSDFQPDYSFNPEPEPFYGGGYDFSGGYEPVQEMQWMDGPSPNWQPSDIKTLVGGASPTHSPMGPPQIVRARSRTPERRESPVRERTRDRERESRARSERPRDRSREKSRRRERGETRERSRSRSKSRKHRSSRSRSPSHRSHKKKKSSKRHSDSE